MEDSLRDYLMKMPTGSLQYILEYCSRESLRDEYEYVLQILREILESREK